MAQETRLIVRKEINVRCSIERAFEVFTSGIDGWWPKQSHSVGEGDCVSVEFEPHAGGRIIEHDRDGSVCEWGRITAWDPPRRVAFTWHPGFDPAQAGDVDVRFRADGANTSVVLEHTGFERRGADAAEMHRNYEPGWEYVFGTQYGEHASRSAG